MSCLSVELEARMAAEIIRNLVSEVIEEIYGSRNDQLAAKVIEYILETIENKSIDRTLMLKYVREYLLREGWV